MTRPGSPDTLDAMSPHVLGLIGGFTVRGEGAPPPVRGLIPQGILARLVLARGEAVAADQLIADLWSTPPDEVLSSLRAHVSRLRGRGWDARLSGGRDGYRLDPSGLDADVWQLERLVSAVGVDRRETLHEAAALWRNDPLGWAREFPFARTATAHLEGLHRRAVAELASVHLDDGDPIAAVAVIQDAATARRVEGGLQLLLAQALTRSGRPSEALRALDDHVEAARAAHLDPHPDVAPLKLAIAQHDPEIYGAADDAARGVERVGIPVPLTRLVGRDDQLQAVRRGRAESRLITLTGAAGVGKTRLAIEIAHVSDATQDEVQWLVDLTTVQAASEVTALVAATVGAAEPTLAAVERVVGGRRGLLILDNSEHVLGAVALVCSDLLGASAGLSILVTSRESLRMAGERVIVVPPMTGERVSDAVDLFIQRASDAAGAQGWEARDRAVIERLCLTLDGLPLAIELAASRLDVLSLDELAGSLRSSTQDSRIDGRHASIDAAIEWSVRLTTPAELALLSQLAEFAGAFTLETAAGICRVDGHDSRQLTVALARKSLIDTVPAPGVRTFRLLESVKQYVATHHPTADRASWAARHALFFERAAGAAAEAYRRSGPKEAKARLRAMRVDVDHALAWAIQHGDRAMAVSMVAALGQYWSERGSGAEALTIIDDALAVPGEALPDLEAAALRAACFIAALTADPLRVVRYTERFFAAAQDAADPVHRMLAGAMSAYLLAASGDLPEMDARLAAAEEARARVGESQRGVIADYLTVRGDVLRVAGRPAQALETLSNALHAAAPLDHGWARAAACFLLGKTLITVGRSHDALAPLRTGVVRFLENDDPAQALAVVSTYAVALTALDRNAEAAEMFGAVGALGDRFGYRGRGVDPQFAADARRRAKAALQPGEWDAASARGATRSLRWVVEHITGSPQR